MPPPPIKSFSRNTLNILALVSGGLLFQKNYDLFSVFLTLEEFGFSLCVQLFSLKYTIFIAFPLFVYTHVHVEIRGQFTRVSSSYMCPRGGSQVVKPGYKPLPTEPLHQHQPPLPT